MSLRKQLPETKYILDNYPEENNVKWLWHSGYWDGPLSGMVIVNGAKRWAEFIDEEEWTEQYGPDELDCDIMDVRFYALLKLTDEQMESEEYWHELFRLCVGTHTDYDKNGQRHLSGVKPEGDSWKFFYGRRKADYKELDLTQAKIVGWFKR